MTKVSVILPCYNVEQYIEKCITSLCEQSLKDIEIICVDDGSTDATPQLLDALSTEDERVIVLHQNNKGAGAARNAGLKLAQGEYLSILDSDDLYNKKMLETAYVKAVLTNADVVMFRSSQYLQQTKEYRETPWAIKREQLPNTEIFNISDIRPNAFWAFQGWTWDKLFRADFVRSHELQFQELRIYNDMYFTFAACLLANRMSYIDQVLIHQRKRGGGSLSDNASPYWECVLHALMAVWQLILTNDSLHFLEDDFRQYALHMIERQLELCNNNDANTMRQALRETWQNTFPSLADSMQEKGLIS